MTKLNKKSSQNDEILHHSHSENFFSLRGELIYFMSEITQNLSDDFKEIIFLPGENHAKYPYSNSLLIDKILIDTGISKRRIKQLLKNNRKIEIIALSHWHEDHCSGNALFPNAQFYCHPIDQRVIENVETMYDLYNIINSPIEQEFKEFFSTFKLKSTPIQHPFAENEMISLSNGLNLRVIHTPGHSAGHCCFYEEKTKICFLADIDLTSFGPWYGCKDSDLCAFGESIKKMQQLDISIAVSSHNECIFGHQQIQNKFVDYVQIIKQRDARILECFTETVPRNIQDLLRRNLIYKKYNTFEGYLIIAEQIMIEQHIRKLCEEKRLIAKETGFILS